MAISPDSTILQEEIDDGYEPTEEEVLEFASWLGMQLPKEKNLLWIAQEGLKAPLPTEWKPCTTDEDEIYYFNFESGESSWDHPCDEFYRSLYQQERALLELEHTKTEPVRKPVQPPNPISPKPNGTVPLKSSLKPNGVIVSSKSNPSKEASNFVGSPRVPCFKDPSAISSPRPKAREKMDPPQVLQQPLVVKWRSAMRGDAQAAAEKQQQQQNHPLKAAEQDRASLDRQTTEKLNLAVHEVSSNDDELEQDARGSVRAMQAEALEKIKKELQEEEDNLVEQRRREIAEEVEKQMAMEKKKLQELELQKMEQELEAEQEKLSKEEAERREAWAAKLKEEEEEQKRMEKDLSARIKKRKEEMAMQLEAETKCLKDESEMRLELFRKSLQEEEMRRIGNERQRTFTEVRDQTVEPRKEEVASLDKSVAEREVLETLSSKLRAEVERARFEMQAQVEAEVASFKEQMQKVKREQTMQEVNEKLELNRQRHRASSSSPRPRIDEPRRSGSSSISSRDRDVEVVETIEDQQHQQVVQLVQQHCRSGMSSNLLQKAACEALLGLVLRNNKECSCCCCCTCCEERLMDLKHSMRRVEEEFREFVTETRRVINLRKQEPPECCLL